MRDPLGLSSARGERQWNRLENLSISGQRSKQVGRIIISTNISLIILPVRVGTFVRSTWHVSPGVTHSSQVMDAPIHWQLFLPAPVNSFPYETISIILISSVLNENQTGLSKGISLDPYFDVSIESDTQDTQLAHEPASFDRFGESEPKSGEHPRTSLISDMKSCSTWYNYTRLTLGRPDDW